MNQEASPASSVSARLEKLPISWVHYKLLLIHGTGWLFDAMDVGIVTFVVVALARDWKLNPGQIGLIGSAGLAGMFVGAALSGWAADRLGRKAVFQVTLLIFSISTLLCSLAWNFESMMIFRFFVGLGLGGELPVVSSLMSEFVPAQARGKFIVLLESFWAYGWILAALIAYLIIPAHGWRIAFAIGALPAFYVWVIRRKLPESPRWLLSRGRTAEAESVLRQLEDESDRITKSAPRVRVNLELGVTDGAVSEPASWRELWSTQFVARTTALWVLWFCLVFGYYGIFIWLPTLLVNSGFSIVRSFQFVLIGALAQIPGYFSAAYLVEKVGRRPVISVFLLMSGLTAICFGHSTTTFNIIFWSSLMSFFNLGAWGAVYTYTPELYPTRIRARGAGMAAAIGRIGGIVAPIVVGMLLPRIGRVGIMLLNAIFFFVGAAVVVWLGDETKGRVLEEISE